jgi:phosphatidate cytidylyltransferase
MLKERILTIAILAPVFIWLVLIATSVVFANVMLCVIAVAAYEWARLSGLTRIWQRLLYAAILPALAVAGQALLPAEQYPYLIYAPAFVWWLLVSGWLIFHRLHFSATIPPAFRLALGIGILLSAWFALVELHGLPEHGPQWVLFLCLIVWAADIGAYVAGKLYGRTKLAPAISPAKTLEGLAGGLLAVAAVGYAGGIYFAASSNYLLLSLVLLTALISVSGDLFESLLKRMAGCKDSGTILPGHGGVLDRIDSVIAAAPVFVLFLSFTV